MQPLSLKGFGLRLIFSLLLVMFTYNPTEYSYIQWLLNTLPSFTPQIALAGIALIIAWVIYVRATLRSLGPIGLGLAGLLFGCVIWLFVDMGWLDPENLSLMTWICLIVLSFILAIGMSWSLVRRRLSGQLDTDDVDDN